MHQALARYFFLLLLLLTSLTLYIYRSTHTNQIGVRVDDAYYIVTGESFAKGNLNRLISDPNEAVQNYYAYGYSFFILAPLYLIFGNNYEVMRYSSLVLGLINVVLVYRFLESRIPKLNCLVVTALFALNDFIAGSSGMVMSENIFLLFLLCFVIWFDKALESHSPNDIFYFLLAATALALGIWTRYWAISILFGLLCYLLFKHKLTAFGIFLIGCGVLLLPLWFLNAFSAQITLRLSGTHSLFGVQSPLIMLQDLYYKMKGYWELLPYTLIPLIGPTITLELKSYGLAWIVNLYNLLILTILGFGVATFKRKTTWIIYIIIAYFTAVIVFSWKFSDTNQVMDVARYTAVMLPFLYWFLLAGIDKLLVYLSLKEATKQKLVLTAGLLIVAVLLFRNYRDVQVGFPMPDLSAGTSWVRDHTKPDAIIMTYDSVSRYLYLQRRTVEIGFDKDISTFLDHVRIVSPDYLLVAPSLLINKTTFIDRETPIPNNEKRLSPLALEVVLPAVNQNPEIFQLEYQDIPQGVYIYSIQN